MSDRLQLTIGMFLQLTGFLIFWLLPATSMNSLWKFGIGSAIFVIGLPFVYVAPALQAKLTSQRTQVRHTIQTRRAFFTLTPALYQGIWRGTSHPQSLSPVAHEPYPFPPKSHLTIGGVRLQGRGQGVRRSAVSLAQIVGPLWASLAPVPAHFWGGMVGFTALGVIVIAAFWRYVGLVVCAPC